MDMCLSDNGLYGPDQTCLNPGIFQNGFHQVRSGGLALGTGNSDDPQSLCRMPEPGGRNKCHPIPGILHPDHGYILSRYLRHRPGNQQHGSLLFHSPGSKCMTVKLCPLDTDKKTSRYHFSGIIYYRRHLHVRFPLYTFKADLPQQIQ